MGRSKRARSLTAQLMLCLLAAALISGALFVGLHFAGQWFVDKYIDTWEFQQDEISRRLIRFQTYVTENDIRADDWESIDAWADEQSPVLLEVSRFHHMLYSSIGPDREAEEELDDLEWWDGLDKTIQFADGQADVFLYYDVPYGYNLALTVIEIVLCAALFVWMILRWSRRLIAYIGTLAGEIQLMAAGDFDAPVTVRGRSELSALARNLDELRVAFREQRDQEAASYAANQELITQMSHDLRTPLTTLLLYTEILKYNKYQGEEQLADYLARIDQKARQIKSLADNIFSYSMQSASGQAAALPSGGSGEAKPLRAVFEPGMNEAIRQLEQSSFTVSARLSWPDGCPVAEEFGRRILDNVFSNILKYADSAVPVDISVMKAEGSAAMCFSNAVRGGAPPADSSGVGLSSLRTMMERQGGSCQVEQTDERFTVTLLFPQSA